MLQEILGVYNFVHRRNPRIRRFGIRGRQRVLGGTDPTFTVSKPGRGDVCARLCVRARLNPPH